MLKKAWSKLKSVTKKNLNRFRARQAVRAGLYEGIDRKAMAALRETYDGHRCQKYQDRFEHSLIRNAERVFTLDLNRIKGLRIFDIGCGFGYFMYGAKQFGHHPVGLDLDDAYLKAVTDLLGLKKVLHRIQPGQPLPDIPGGPFDLITAFATCFDNAGLEGQWRLADWQYFMQDLRRFMAPGCKVFFKFNQYVGPGTKSGIGCRTVPPDLWEYFQSLGGTFDKRFMTIVDAPTHLARKADSGKP
jgi:SAM-dependent methyltransferase